MPRPRKNPISPASTGGIAGNFSSWAESLGEALGRGVARGINAGLAGVNLGGGAASSGAAAGARRRGRPPKVQTGGPVPADRRCKAPGCEREARSKGLCSAHYQAERRRVLAKQASKS
jgi:hypothetical protein